MSRLPNPIDDKYEDEAPKPIRILSDRGIEQAIERGYMLVDPPIDLKNPGKRLQPSTIDLEIREVMSHFVIGSPRNEGDECFQEDLTLRAGRASWIELEEIINFQNATTPLNFGFFQYFLDCRSSLLRLGGVMLEGWGPQFPPGVEALVLNSSPNNIIFDPRERIAQAFIRVDPYADTCGVCFDIRKKPPTTKQGDEIRTLDMGVQVKTEEELKAISKKGYMKIDRSDGRRLEYFQGLILMHASRAYRMKKIGEIHFSKRDSYKKEDLLEEVNIRREYFVKEGEHLIVEVEESFDLSPHVGVSVLNNLIGENIPGAPKLFGFSPTADKRKDPKVAFRRSIHNCAVNLIRNSWIDPGYKGMMTGFPKLLGKSIQRGDVVGYAQCLFYPNGVKHPYGSTRLQSQYQGASTLQLAK